MSRKASRPSTWVCCTLAAILLGLLAVLLFDRSMRRELDHDEHQFVASGAQLADRGLLPYRDYPYFHLPNLTALYATAFSITPYRLLAARAISVAAFVAVIAIVLFSATVRFARPWPGLLAGIGVAGMLLLDPIIRHTTGLAWNHDVPVALLLIGLALGSAGAGEGRRSIWLVVAGAALGLAGGTRASFLPALLPAAAFILAGSEYARRRRDLLLLILGIALGLLPSMIPCGLAPSGCLFGNLTYASLNTAYRIEQAPEATMTFEAKVIYLIRTLAQPTSLTLTLLMLVTLVGVLSPAAGMPSLHRMRALASAAMVCLLLLAGLLPTPSWPQYYFAPIAVGSALAVWGAAEVLRRGQFRPLLAVAVLGAGVLAVTVPSLWRPDEWRQARSLGLGAYVPLQVRQLSSRVRDALTDVPTVTLSPIYVVEAGGELVPPFTTGPFAYRIAYLVPASQRQSLGLFGPDETAEYLRQHPVSAVLVGGDEPRLDQQLSAIAREGGLHSVPINDPLQLWLPPGP